MKRWAPFAAILVAASYAVAGGLGVGSGGLQGAPASAASASLGDGGVIGGCTISSTGTLYCPVGKFDVLDAGALNVVGAFGLGTGCLSGTTSAVTIGCSATTASNTSLTAGANSTFILGTGLSNFRVGGSVTDSVVAPTVTACTSPSVTWSNGTASLKFAVGSSCTGIKTATITLPTTTNCWTCSCWDATTTTNNVRQTGCSTTTAVVTNFAGTAATPTDWTAAEAIQCLCRGG